MFNNKRSNAEKKAQNRKDRNSTQIKGTGEGSNGGSGKGRMSLADIATSTLKAIDEGAYDVNGVAYALGEKVNAMKKDTVFYPADSNLSEWSSNPPTRETLPPPAHVTAVEVSTLVGARTLHENLQSLELEEKRIGILNFASAKNPGGGFLGGAQAQEESIARSSTIYPSLITETAERFYRSHRKDPKKGYYSHAMIYTPHCLLLRADDGEWMPPIEVEMVTSCAVNAGVVRRYLRENKSDDESDLEAAMKERMSRILYLFEKRGIRNLVLGSFGTGVFRNKVEVVARIWAKLLTAEDARFRHSFDRVVFAVLGHPTFLTFQGVFKGDTVEGSSQPRPSL